ncbi:MAG: hypothetical protein PHW25_21090 [Zoogloea sp.]|uniref:hypothetical protein n=1 Tax=Zoogloea sp. TaxID=49181 RepID=UPI00261809B1|nr:hypothetical protein [Zoogloea sp.]MDD3329582.1 hypothetical protein [Zoogloea sp.]
MKTFSVYEIESGRLTGARVGATGDVDPDWIPAGCSVVFGEWDHERWRVDHETGALEAIEPPEPDWRIKKFAAVDSVMAEITAAEAEQARPMREIVEAMLAGTSPPAEATARFNAIKQRIEAARNRLSAINATTTQTELEAIELQPA